MVLICHKVVRSSENFRKNTSARQTKMRWVKDKWDDNIGEWTGLNYM